MTGVEQLCCRGVKHKTPRRLRKGERALSLLFFVLGRLAGAALAAGAAAAYLGSTQVHIR